MKKIISAALFGILLFLGCGYDGPEESAAPQRLPRENTEAEGRISKDVNEKHEADARASSTTGKDSASNSAESGTEVFPKPSSSIAQVHRDLVTAATQGDNKKVKHLLDNDSDITAKDCAVALLAACLNGHDAAVEVLLTRVTEKKDLGTALQIAAAFGHTTILQTLLQAGADVNTKDKDGYTALMIAAKKGNTESVKALIANGAQLDATDTDGDTALTLAAKQGHSGIVKLLQEAGALRPMNLPAADDVDRLIEQLRKDKDWTDRCDAAKRLGKIGDRKAVPALIEALYKKDGDDARVAELKKIGIGAPYVFVAVEAARALGEIRDPQSIKPLIAVLHIGDIGESAKEALVKIGEPSIEFLISALDSIESKTRSRSVEALGNIGSLKAVEPVIRVLNKDSNAKVRTTAAKVLGKLRDRRAIEHLKRACRGDFSRSVRASAFGSLITIDRNVLAEMPLNDSIQLLELYLYENRMFLTTEQQETYRQMIEKLKKIAERNE